MHYIYIYTRAMHDLFHTYFILGILSLIECKMGRFVVRESVLVYYHVLWWKGALLRASAVLIFRLDL